MSIDDTNSMDEQRRKRGPKRRKVNHACLYCRRSHMTCDEGRPCQRCIKREIGHLCHDEPKNQTSSQPQSISSNNTNSSNAVAGSSSSSSMAPLTTLGEAHAAHVSKYPDQAPPLLEIMHGFPVPVQAPDSIPFGGAPNPHVQHYPQQQMQQTWPSFLQDSYGMQGDAQASNLGNELNALHTFIENFGDGQAFFNSPQPQSTSSQPQSLPPSHQPLPLASPHQRQQLQNGTPHNTKLSIDPSSSISPTSPRQGTRTPSMPHLQDQTTPTPSQPQSVTAPNGLDTSIGMGLNGMNGFFSQPSSSGTGTGSNQNTPTSANAPSSTPRSASQPMPPNSISTSSTNTNTTQGQGPAPIVPASKQEAFLLTAADQATGSRDERLSRVIRSKYEAGLLKPYNYVNGYSRLSQWMERNVTPESKQQILEPLSILRPKFRAVAQSLTDMDLVMIEEAFERLLLDYDRVFSAMAIPACLWRRTGEIYKANREFAELIGVENRFLREGQLTIYELMDEEAAVNYWEKYGHVAFDTGQKAVLTTCVLRYKPVISQQNYSAITSNIASGGSLPPFFSSNTNTNTAIPRTEESLIRCCFSFTIRRDAWGIPTMIVGNFIRL